MTTRVRSQRLTLRRIFTVAFLFLVTLMMSARWATSQEQGGVPAFNAGPEAQNCRPSLAKTNSGAPTLNLPIRLTPTIWQLKFRPCFTSSPAIAIATAWAITACIAALKTRTGPGVLPASKRSTIRTNSTRRVGRRHRFVRASSRASGSRKTSKPLRP